MKSEKVRTKAMALAICMVFLVAVSGVLSAASTQNVLEDVSNIKLEGYKIPKEDLREIISNLKGIAYLEIDNKCRYVAVENGFYYEDGEKYPINNEYFANNYRDKFRIITDKDTFSIEDYQKIDISPVYGAISLTTSLGGRTSIFSKVPSIIAQYCIDSDISSIEVFYEEGGNRKEKNLSVKIEEDKVFLSDGENPVSGTFYVSSPDALLFHPVTIDASNENNLKAIANSEDTSIDKPFFEQWVVKDGYIVDVTCLSSLSWNGDHFEETLYSDESLHQADVDYYFTLRKGKITDFYKKVEVLEDSAIAKAIYFRYIFKGQVLEKILCLGEDALYTDKEFYISLGTFEQDDTLDDLNDAKFSNIELYNKLSVDSEGEVANGDKYYTSSKEKFTGLLRVRENTYWQIESGALKYIYKPPENLPQVMYKIDTGADSNTIADDTIADRVTIYKREEVNEEGLIVSGSRAYVNGSSKDELLHGTYFSDNLYYVFSKGNPPAHSTIPLGLCAGHSLSRLLPLEAGKGIPFDVLSLRMAIKDEAKGIKTASMWAIKQVAQEEGLLLKGYELSAGDEAEKEQSLKLLTQPAIIHTRKTFTVTSPLGSVEKEKCHYLVVEVNGDKVTYTDYKDGQVITKEVDIGTFLTEYPNWDGYVLTAQDLAGITELTDEQMKAVWGEISLTAALGGTMIFR